jgi:hypothetical protein
VIERVPDIAFAVLNPEGGQTSGQGEAPGEVGVGKIAG